MKIEFTEKNHGHRLLQQLNAQRRDGGARCNMALRVGAHVYPAHREVLAAASPFIDEQLGGGGVRFKDDFSIVIDVGLLGAEAAEQLLDYLYTGRVTLEERNAGPLLSAARHLALPALRAHCRDFLLQSLRPSNCLRRLALARRHALPDLTERAYCCLRDGFHALGGRQLAACPQCVLERLVRDPELRVRGEDQVLLALVQWARGRQSDDEVGEGLEVEEEECEGDRACAFESMFANVLLSAISECVLVAVARDELLVARCPAVLALLQQELACRRGGMEGDELPPAEPRSAPSLTLLQRRGALLDAVLVMGGQRTNGHYSDAIFAYVVPEDSWLKLADMPYRAAALGATTLGQHVYLTGGASEEDTSLRAAWRYDVDTGSWTKLPDLPQGLVFHTMVACGGSVYTVGGSIASRKYTANIYRYNPRKERWSLAGRMSVPMDGAEVITKEDKCIYIVTGRCIVKGTLCRMGVVDCFDTTTREVVQCMTFPIKFKHRPLVSFQEENVLAVQSHMQSLEINLQKVKATTMARTVPPMPGNIELDICHAVCRLAGQNVFVCGGLVSDDQPTKPYIINKNACLFNQKQGEWRLLAQPPEALDCAACCTAQIPRKCLPEVESQLEQRQKTITDSEQPKSNAVHLTVYDK